MTEPDAKDPAATPNEASPSTTAAEGNVAELAQWKDKALRARADYDNLSRRVARDAQLERERAKARVLEAFLPIHELAQMAAHQAEAHPGPVSEGVVLMAREFARLLEREGLVALGKTGEPFDPALHEAVAEEASPAVPKGHVARVVLPGYKLADKVLRHAKVTVSTGPAPASSSTPGAT